MIDVVEIPYISYFLTFLWITAIIVYAAKFFWKWWDDFTRFGKLEKIHTSFPSIPNKLGWIIFFSCSCIMFLICHKGNISNQLLLLHSFRRLIESLTITKFSDRKMHLINLAAGLMFYFMTPLTLTICEKRQHKMIFWIIAITLNAIQFLAHLTLSSLVKYTIPKNPLFKVVISPHYLCEILLYITYFASAPGIQTFLMAFFVALNLTHQATMTYHWY